MRKDVGRRYVGRARQLRVQCNMGQHSRKPLAMRTTHLRFLKIVKKDPQWANGPRLLRHFCRGRCPTRTSSWRFIFFANEGATSLSVPWSHILLKCCRNWRCEPLEMQIERFADLALAPGAIRTWTNSSRASHHQPGTILSSIQAS
jgi:hypothetical protein